MHRHHTYAEPHGVPYRAARSFLVNGRSLCPSVHLLSYGHLQGGTHAGHPPGSHEPVASGWDTFFAVINRTRRVLEVLFGIWGQAF